MKTSFAILTAFLTVAGGVLAQDPVPAEKIEKITQALPAKAPAKPQHERKVLVFCRCEGFRHSCIPVGNKAMELLGEKTGAYTATVSQDYADFTPANLAKYDAVLLNNTTKLKLAPEQQQALQDFVKGGKGLVGIHAASDNFYDWPEGAAMIGGQFDGHPWGAGGTWSVKINDPHHVLNRSFDGKGFLINDEIYQIKGAYSHATHRELLSLDMSYEPNNKVNGIKRTDGDFPISWVAPYGKGRVFYCSLGHNEHIYWNQAVLAHYLAGIQYAIGDLKVDDKPSAPAEKK